MHHVNFFWVNLRTAYKEQCISVTISSLTKILFYIREYKKICAHNYSRTAVYFERFSVVLGHSPKACCPKHLIVEKGRFLSKWASNLVLGVFSISEVNRIKDDTVSIRYIPINFDRKFNRKKCHNSLFFRNQTQRTKDMLKTLCVCIN